MLTNQFRTFAVASLVWKMVKNSFMIIAPYGCKAKILLLISYYNNLLLLDKQSLTILYLTRGGGDTSAYIVPRMSRQNGGR